MKGNANLKNEKIEVNKEKKIKSLEEEDEPPSQGYRTCILDIEAEARFVTEARILVIGLREANNGSNHIFYDKNEEVLVRRFINYFNKNAFEKIVGYNTPYDYRHIFSKCLKYCIPLGHFYHADIIDLMQILKNVKNTNSYNKAGTLQEWAIYLFGEGKLQKNGSVGHLFHQAKINELISYNKQDLQLTHMLWQRINLVLRGCENG